MHLKRKITLKELCEIIDARPGKEPGLEVTDIAEPSEARENDIIYLADKKHREAVDRSRARVVLTSPALAQGLSKDKILLLSDKLQESFIRLLDFFEDKDKSSNTVSDSSVVHGSVKQGRDITIMDHVFISQDAVIGDGSVIYPHVYIGRKVTLGKNCVLWPNVTIYNGCQIADHVILHSGVAIGCDGFGYIQVDGKNVKVPQIGNVIIEEEVEIGAHTTIDRATIGSTIIRKGVKIDNLVQIAHNVEIGENSIVASQTGISGSTKVGRNCVLLGQVGLADHAVIEDNVVIGAQTGIPSRTVRSEEKFVFGYPGRPLMQAKRIEAVISKLPELYQEFNELKKKIEEKLK